MRIFITVCGCLWRGGSCKENGLQAELPVRIIPTETWGAPSCRLFAFEVKD
ncbi:MAG: hypothetical protein K6G44_16515 [Lentisphaeria bacterium]|nr:hypothetical protein [Lentisphaeria bacterium]